MPKRFPHLDGATDWPGYGREVFEQVPGDFDPDLWEEGATITLCSVPWGVYEAGVSDDVPGFDSAAERDAWFEQWLAATATESHVLDTAVRYQLSRSVELPFTFDSLARYNYLVVDYADAPVPGAGPSIRRWYYHIVGYDYEAPSCTALTLQPDWWVQCACEMEYGHMMLHRGHAPASMVTPGEFLSAPLSHTRWLMGDDPTFGQIARVAASAERVFNSGDQWVVLCFAGLSLDAPLTGRYEAPYATAGMVSDGGPGDYQLGVRASDYTRLMGWFAAENPKYLFAIDAVYMADGSLLAFDRTFSLGGVEVRAGTHGRTLETSVKLTPEAFGYGPHASRFAKLYTYPYAVIEVADHTGAAVQVRVEDLAGPSVSAVTVFNSAYPWLALDTHIPGIGGAARTVTFRTMDRETFAGGGRWWDTLLSWGVPCFKVDVSNEVRNRVQGHWDRVQRKNDADTSLANAVASADTAYANAVRSADTALANAVTNADTARTNANASADTAYANSTASNSTAQTNAKASNATAQANNGRVNDNATAVKNLRNAYNTDIQATDHSWLVTHTANGNAVVKAMTDADVALSLTLSQLTNSEIAMTTALNNVSGALTAGAQAVSGVMGGTDGLMGAGADIIGTGISNFFASTAANVVISKNSAAVDAAQLNSNTKLEESLKQTAYNQGYADVVTDAHTRKANSLADGTTAANVATSAANAAATKATGDANADRTKATGDANATRTRDTAKANATRSHDSAVDTATASQETSVANAAASQATSKANAERSYDNSLEAVENGVRSANLREPVSMGSPADGETFNTRPMYLSVNVLTQNEGAIERTASMFARYGYTLDSEWDFRTFNICRHFTYWQVSSVWAKAPYLLPERGQDAVRRMLYDGVTAWRDPEEIGRVSVYDN